MGGWCMALQRKTAHLQWRSCMHAFCQLDFGKTKVPMAKYTILSSEEAWQMWNSLKDARQSFQVMDLRWKWHGWHTNTSWHRSDPLIGLTQRRTDAVNAFTQCRVRWGTDWGLGLTHSMGLDAWRSVSDSRSLNVRQLMHTSCTNRCQTCLKQLNLSTESLGLILGNV